MRGLLDMTFFLGKIDLDLNMALDLIRGGRSIMQVLIFPMIQINFYDAVKLPGRTL